MQSFGRGFKLIAVALSTEKEGAEVSRLNLTYLKMAENGAAAYELSLPLDQALDAVSPMVEQRLQALALGNSSQALTTKSSVLLRLPALVSSHAVAGGYGVEKDYSEMVKPSLKVMKAASRWFVLKWVSIGWVLAWLTYLLVRTFTEALGPRF